MNQTSGSSPVADFVSGLGAAFMDAEDAAQIMALLERSLPEVADFVGATAVSLFIERVERDRVESIAQWVASDAADPGQLPKVAMAQNRVAFERAMTETWSTVATSSPFPTGSDADCVLSVPLSNGSQRAALVFCAASARAPWSDVDRRFAESLAKLFGRALHLAQSETLLAITFHHGPIGFSVRTYDGIFVDSNRQYLDLLGTTSQRVRSGNLRELVHPDDRQRVSTEVERLRNGSTTRIRFETRVNRADLGWRWVRVNSTHLDHPGTSEPLILTSIEDVDELHARREQLEYAASHDSLTGVANRTALRDRIDQCALLGQVMPSLLIIDLDRFKLLNDSMGHMVGDEVLALVAQRLVEHVRDDDFVARVGGDEFAVVVPDVEPEGVHLLAERLRRSVELPLLVGGRSIPQTISIGIAIGEECASTAELLVRADRAMYAAKASGRNGHVVFDQTMRDRAEASAVLERELRQAIDRDQLVVHFQPEFSLRNRVVLGAEALLRWHHPRLGLLNAEYFISAAERSGMIDEIGRFALREACRSFAEMAAANDTGLVLRVNVSGREFVRPELPDLVRTALAEARLAPQLLCLEMTETTLMDGSPDVVLETFARLHDIGVEFAIDDFGTGYSSLTYLKQFPVDALKIDRSFVDDIETNADSLAIVESIIGLGAALSLQVVAEGIENESQFDILRGLGCTRAQGNLVSRAVPPSEFPALVHI